MLGQSLPRVGGRDLVTGRHQYASDLVRPGMLHGKVLRPPSFGAKIASVDTHAAEAITGVVVVRDEDFIGVAAASEALAERALSVIEASFTPVAQPSSKTLFAHLKTELEEGGGGGARRQHRAWLGERRPRGGGRAQRANLHRGVHRPRAARAAGRARRVAG
ncbi:MAG: hypothetical protein U1E76_23010 [Planctomycetota bacterium]